MPTAARPWIVQDYIDGIDVCTFAVARHGRLALHCTYVHPRQIENAGGIVFESIVDADALACAERIVVGDRLSRTARLRLPSQPRRPRRCSSATRTRPRASTSSPTRSSSARCWRRVPATPRVVPAGRRRLYASALLRDLLHNPSNLVDDLAYLRAGVRDIYAERGDRMPALYQVLSYCAGRSTICGAITPRPRAPGPR